MHIRFLLTTTAAIALIAGGASAQDESAAQNPVPTGPQSTSPEIDTAQQGVLVFEPAFFADASPNTALDMVMRLPGFALNTGDTSQRGFAGSAGNVLIDGDRPSSKSDNLMEVLRRISAASVERIELIRGGAPGIDMQGQAVVANIVVKKNVQVEKVLEFNSYIYPDGYIGPILQGQYSRRDGENLIQGSLMGTVDRTDGTGEGYRRRYDTNGNLIQDADLVLWDRFENIRGTGVIERGLAGGKLRLNGLAGWFRSEQQQDLLIRSGGGSDAFNDEEVEDYNFELGANWTREFNERMELELIGLQRYSTSDYVGLSEAGPDSSTFSADAASGESIGRAVFRYRPNDRWSFETGGEIAYNFLDSDTAYEENGTVIPLPNAAVKVEETRGEVFGQTTWRPNPKLTVEAGLRVEVSEISQTGDTDLAKSFVYPKPRMQLTWTPSEGHQFRFRAEREVGQLDFGDFSASADIDIGQVEGGNADLEPFKANVFEAVYERRFWGEGVFDVTYMHADVEDVVDVIPLTGGFDGVGNIGDGTQDLFQLRLTLPTDKLGISNGRFQVRGSWVTTSVIDPVTGEERRFQGNQNFGCGVSFNQDLRGGRWSYGFDHGCNIDRGKIYRVREVRELYQEPFVNAFVQWKPKPDLTIRADIGNATDRAAGYDRLVYAGSRDTAPVAYKEERRTWMSPWLFLQIRKSF